MNNYSEWIKIDPVHYDLPVLGQILQNIFLNPTSNPYLNISGFSISSYTYSNSRNKGVFNLISVENKTIQMRIRVDADNDMMLFLIVFIIDEA